MTERGNLADCGRVRLKSSSEISGLDIREKSQMDNFTGRMMNSVFDVC